MSQTKKFLYPILIIMLSCLLGTGAMIANNTPINIWIQNISVIILFTFITIFISKFKFKLNYKLIVFISILLLLLTFLQGNNVGVHRWIQLSSFSLNISMIVIPLTIIAVNNLFKNKHCIFICKHYNDFVNFIFPTRCFSINRIFNSNVIMYTQ